MIEVAELIKTRWSPRAFDDITIPEEEVMALFEAARRAPSSMNEQPWKYYYALKEDVSQFNRFINCLNPGNRVWAKNASVLILSTAAKKFNYNGRLNKYALHDTGAANLQICLQANDMGYQAHQMGGFDQEKTLEEFGIDSNDYEPVTFIAIGKPGDASTLPEHLRKTEGKPGQRKDIYDIVKRLK